MELDNLFDNKNKRQGNFEQLNPNDNNRNSHYSSHEQGTDFNWLNILEKIRTNKKLKLLVISAVILILVIAVVLIIALMPLIMKLLNYVSQNGLQGLIDLIMGYVDKILKGSAK